jgi:hypothetical protein
MAPGAVAVLFCVAGLVMLATGIATLTRTRRFLKFCASSTGTVARIVCPEYLTAEDATYYAALVEFRDAAGSPVAFECPNGADPPPYREGQQVTVLYDAANPRHAVIKSFMSLWYTALTLLGAGAVFTVGGLLLLLTR